MGIEYEFDVARPYGGKESRFVQDHYEGHTYMDGRVDNTPHFNIHQKKGSTPIKGEKKHYPYVKKGNKYIMMKKITKNMQHNISLPFQIKALLKDLPNYEISLIDYDYIGDAKETDFVSFANQLYGRFETFPNMKLIIHSNEMTDSRLLRKMFRFDLTEYCFNEKIETLTLPINETQIVFLGIISIDTPEDVKDVIKFLFSGIYESGDFIMYSHTPSDIGHIKNLLKNSLQIVTNRHGDIKKVLTSLSYICQHKNNLKILYPYGGTDFGSFMLFEL